MVSLADKYDLEEGRALISGNQALVRLTLLQRDLDAAAGLNSGGYISGYRGSPLGGVDMAFWREQARLDEANIHFKPGVNEDLAATAIWGTQQFDAYGNATVDGVFALWYGKGPGVDRSGDPMKHGNLYGTHRNGGVLVVYGDDHPGKSSSVAHQSELALAANSIPSLYPANVAEIMSYGLAGWALSRYAGVWVGLKTVNETVEQTLTVDFSALKKGFATPEPEQYPEEGVHFRPGHYNPVRDEQLLLRYRLPLVRQFVYANHLDRVQLDNGPDALGLVTSGKAYGDVRQALQLLGIDDKRAAQLRLSVYKVACIWPLEPRRLREFAHTCRELMFIEEKRPVMQDQAAGILYAQENKPAITGKVDDAGAFLLPSDSQLQAIDVAVAIAARLESLGLADKALLARASVLERKISGLATHPISPVPRTPYFCSGCPHNTSTRLPEGSIAGAGIGCHGMAMFYRPDTLTFSQMGGEGATWNGISPFSETRHIFQNLGEGTYYHSGALAIRAAVAAGVNITYKVLFNDAVAMTGGQPVDGPLSVGDIAHQVLNEGVRRCVVVTDAPQTYEQTKLPAGVEVFARSALDQVQRELRETPGCTVLIYEQTCATEKRRRRKRGRMAPAPKRLFINSAVCEGCGDCSTQSSCMSIQPKDTALGRKRKIDQHSCNQDYSCLNGFCPSFVSVYGGQLRRQKASTGLPAAELPEPDLPASDPVYSIMIAGIGGTGVISVGAILAMAAHLEGKRASAYDMTGLAQKGGGVYSHLRIAETDAGLGSQKIGLSESDLVLGFDLLATLAGDAVPTFDPGRTILLANEAVNPTAAFQRDQTLNFQFHEPLARAAAFIGEDRVHHQDFSRMAVKTCGDSIAGNMMAVGYAVQKGLLPVAPASVEKAIALNGVAVEMNLRAFAFGRHWAQDPACLTLSDSAGSAAPATAEDIARDRHRRLVDYQNLAYARRYQHLVDKVVAAEDRAGTDGALSATVARVFYRLMAYKDEYEVARLYAEPAFTQSIEQQFEGDFKLRFNLAPPLLARRDPATGRLKKREFGPWVLPAFRVLARLRFLRGTRFDVFGLTAERRGERQLIAHYESLIERVVGGLSPETCARAVALAELADMVRGYGHIKESNLELYREREAKLLREYECNRIEKAA